MIVAILGALVVALVTILVLQGRSAASALETGERSARVVAIAKDQETRVLELAAALRGFVITGDATFLEPLPQVQQALRADFARLKELVSSSAVDARIDEVSTRVDRFTSDWLPTVIDARRRGAGEAVALLATGEGEMHADAIRSEINVLVAAETEQEAIDETAGGRKLRQTTLLASSALGILLVGCALATLFLRRRVIRPVVAVARTADAIAAGAEDARVGLSGTDEVGRLCAAFDEMAESVSATRSALETRNADLEREKRIAERAQAVTEAVLAATPAAICLFHPSGLLLMGNRPLTEIPAVALVDLDYRTPISDDLEDPETGQFFRRHLATIAFPDGSDLGSLLVVDDITRERAAERLKSDLIATVSHELRTPLAAILGYSEILARRDPEFNRRQRYAETIHREADRLTRLVSDLLDVQRIEQGRMPIALHEFDLVEVVREQASTYAGQTAPGRISVTGADAPIAVIGDRDRTGQVVANLLSNAIKYSKDSGRVAVDILSDGRRATVWVRDEGIGMSPEDREHVFDRFFRADAPDVAAVRGSGLGLSVAQDIVRAHGGSLSVESTLGQGSAFCFDLPVAIPADADG